MPRKTCVVGLTPEYKRAVAKLTRELGSYDLAAFPGAVDSLTSEVCAQDAFHVSHLPFFARDLPSDTHWRWNQTKGHQKTTIAPGEARVNILKLCPRRRMSHEGGDVPQYKMWWFEVMPSAPGSSSLYAFWCERGRTVAPVTFEMLDELEDLLTKEEPLDLHHSELEFGSLPPLLDLPLPTELLSSWSGGPFDWVETDTCMRPFSLADPNYALFAEASL